jgi:serine/threonine protein kinase/tetratricopeptide (TPR) repeat protein
MSDETPRCVTADRNLLFGILALQMDFISSDQLVAAVNAWVLDKVKPLSQHLLEQNTLTADECSVLEPLVTKHLEKHQNNPEKSLATLTLSGSTVQTLARISDLDLETSLGHLGKSSRPDDRLRAHHATSAGMPTFAGERFRILRPHRAGGVGEVFVAHDLELHREVALKQIQERHADDPESRARFMLEAEITGQLEHPGVVPIYGLGRYPDGRPFYAMRFIKGDSFSQAIELFHDSKAFGFQGLEFRKLLQRFVDVCNVIAYANSRGVLHRDLKPSNVMLGPYGETLIVDWGLAKAVGQPDQSASGQTACPAHQRTDAAMTQVGAAVGTPAYMSPEQAAGKLELLGPASDVYSLGATLYKVLTGHAPIEGSDISTSLLRVQCGDFPRPRLINTAVPRALEAVCLKAMAQQPADRYPSGRELAEDIQRWLADEAIQAYVEPWQDRTRRWSRRHRTLMTGLAAALMVALGGMSIGLVWQTAASRRERDLRDQADVQRERASEAERVARANELEARSQAALAQTEGRRAEKSADEARAVLDFFQTKVLAAARPLGQKGGLGRETTIRQALDAAGPQIAKAFVDQPAVEAAIRHTLGQTYFYLGDYPHAIEQHERARAMRRSLLGPTHPDTLLSMNSLATAYTSAGRLTEGIGLHEETLKQQKSVLGVDHPDTLHSMNNLAEAYRQAGRLDEALTLHEETWKRQKLKFGRDDPESLRSANNLADAYRQAHRLDEAIQLHKETLNLRKARLGPEHPETLSSMNNLAISYLEADRVAEGSPLLEDVLRIKKARLGPSHPSTLNSMTNLATLYEDTGRRPEAIQMFEEALKIQKQILATDHRVVLENMANLALANSNDGRPAAAVALYEEVLKRQKSKLGPDRRQTLKSMNDLAAAYRAAGRLDEGVRLAEEALNRRKAKLGLEDADTTDSMTTLALLQIAKKQYGSAETVLTEATALVSKRKGATPAAKANMQMLLGDCLLLEGKFARAESELRACLAVKDKVASDAWRTSWTRSLLGSALAGLKKYALAEPLLVSGYEGMVAREKQIPVPEHVLMTEAGERLVALYIAWDKNDKAEEWRRRLHNAPAATASK